MRQLASGLRAWALQRISAIYLGLFILYLLVTLITAPPADYGAWKTFVAQPLVSIGLLLFYVSLLIHAWVGIRDVLIDYVHPLSVRLLLMVLFGLMLLASGLWAMEVIILARLN